MTAINIAFACLAILGVYLVVVAIYNIYFWLKNKKWRIRQIKSDIRSLYVFFLWMLSLFTLLGLLMGVLIPALDVFADIEKVTSLEYKWLIWLLQCSLILSWMISIFYFLLRILAIKWPLNNQELTDIKAEEKQFEEKVKRNIRKLFKKTKRSK